MPKLTDKRPPPDYYQMIKKDRCLCCGHYGSLSNPIEAAHIETVLSPKTGDIMPRSHKGPSAWSAIPLCQSCHELQHQNGPEAAWLTDNVGRYKAQGKVISQLLDFYASAFDRA